MNANVLVALLGAALVMVWGPAHAQAGGAAKGAAGGVTEQQVRTLFEQRSGQKPTSVARAPLAGMWEVVVGADIFYVDPEVNYVLNGQLFDARTRENLTQKKRDELLRVDWKALPLNQAIKLVRGNGSRVFATFEDPNCSFCRKLHTELQEMKDATIYVFLYPILSADSFEAAKNIWCAKNRGAAWDDHMIRGKAPPAAAADCKHPLQDNVQLGQKYGVNGTPTIIFTDGSRAPGAVPIAQIEQRVSEASKKK